MVIVGWDDNYDRSNFSTTPPGNGAWIVRNSWGTDWGEAGYFYLSYYDSYAGANPTAFNNAKATSNYNRIYQFDPLGKTSARGYDTGTRSSWGDNIFTAAASENLTAISTPQTDYAIPMEAPQAGYSSGASANAGESFISADGSGSWYDTGYNDDANVCIKAFAAGQSVATLTSIKITSPADKLTYQIGEALDLLPHPYPEYRLGALAL